MTALNLAQSLDHFDVAVDDLVADDEFSAQVFGGEIPMRNGLNLGQR
ncbi:MAG: hypothetical protein ACM3SP_26560 [Chloroflexota bacterium]